MLEIVGMFSVTIAIIAVVLSAVLLAKPAARSGLIGYIFLFMLLTSFFYAVHAGIDIFGPSLGINEELVEQLYAVTAIIASLFVFFLVVVVQIIAKLLTRKR